MDSICSYRLTSSTLTLTGLRRFVIITVVLVPTLACGQAHTTERYQPVELTFTADTTFQYQPQRVTLGAIFQGPDGRQIEIAGFWDGANRFLVRFAPPTTGTWHYETTASDTTLSNLHDQAGTIQVTPYTGNDPFAARGWPEVSENGRFLTYADGTPYFYLGDTAWEISWKSYKDRIRNYLDDREEKGYNAIQIVVMSHQRIRKHGVRNRYGESFFEDENFTRINPRYFDYVDWIVNQINGHGMMAVLVPLWAYMTEFYADSWPPLKLSEKQSLSLARYVGARYAGHNVLWFVGGDNKYDTPARKQFWDRFAWTLDKASGRQHLMTVHPHGYGSSFDYFSADTTDWLDFHAYQSSHVAGDDYTWKAAQRGYELEPTIPVVNAEATYEDIYNRFWAPGDTSKANTFRIRPVHVRQASYESVLSGAFVGMAYGGNGVWQWNTKELPGSHQPRYTVDQAWGMPGSEDIGFLKEFMVEIDWHTLRPAQHLVTDKSAPDYVPTAASSDQIASYLPAGTKYVEIDASHLGPLAEYLWIDPAAGDTVTEERKLIGTRDPYDFVPPDTADWLLSVTPADVENPTEPLHDTSFESLGNAPNPFSSETEIRFHAQVACTVRVTIWNLLGRRVREDRVSSFPGEFGVPVRLEQPGLYVYRAVFTAVNGAQSVVRGKLLAVPR